MLFTELREPINAWSHGAGMVLAIPATWLLWTRWSKLASEYVEGGRLLCSSRFERGKILCLLCFGVSLTSCYGISALFHGVRLSGEPLRRLQRLDHVGIFLLIAGTYTPVAWSLMRGAWRSGTLVTVWTIAAVCATRVWCGNVMPMWVSTLIYLGMGWGALFCYFELARRHSHRQLAPLPVGGMFYSIGAVFNLARWPVLIPGVFAAHELFHFFVIAGSACHTLFMLKVVIPAPETVAMHARWKSFATSSQHEHVSDLPTRRGARWLHHVPGRPCASNNHSSDCRAGTAQTPQKLPPDSNSIGMS